MERFEIIGRHERPIPVGSVAAAIIEKMEPRPTRFEVRKEKDCRAARNGNGTHDGEREKVAAHAASNGCQPSLSLAGSGRVAAESGDAALSHRGTTGETRQKVMLRPFQAKRIGETRTSVRGRPSPALGSDRD